MDQALAEPGGRAPGAGDIAAALPELRRRLLRHARLSLRDEAAAEDLVQDTLIVVVEQHATRRGDASLRTWATAILKNKIADWYRAPARRHVVQLSAQDEELGDALDGLFNEDGHYADAVPAWEQPENREEWRQMMSVLERCMAGLPPQTARVFMMREWLGFENPEICQRLGISADNCRMLLHRARSALRVCLQHGWIEGRG